MARLRELIARLRVLLIWPMAAVFVLIAGTALAIDATLPGDAHPITLDGLIGALVGGAMSFGAIRQRLSDHEQRIRDNRESVKDAHARIDRMLGERHR